MVPFFELRDPSVAGGMVTSGESSRVLVVDGSPELERWLLGLALPPPGVLFLHRRDLATARDVRLACAVGASFLPQLDDVTLVEWVLRAAATAERPSFRRDDAETLLENLGLRFLARTALAHVPPDLRPRASLAAALASNRPVLVADASTGFGTLDRDETEYATWDRACEGRDVVLLLPRHAATSPFRDRGWVLVNEAPPAVAPTPLLRVRANASAQELAGLLRGAGFACAVDDGELYVRRVEPPGQTVQRLAASLHARGLRLREASAFFAPIPEEAFDATQRGGPSPVPADGRADVEARTP